MDLIRHILLTIESHGSSRQVGRVEVEGYEQAEIAYNIEALVDGGYLDGQVQHLKVETPPTYLIHKITWAGHEYVGNIRDDRFWKMTKEKAKKVAGSVSIALMNEIATVVLRSKIPGSIAAAGYVD